MFSSPCHKLYMGSDQSKSSKTTIVEFPNLGISKSALQARSSQRHPPQPPPRSSSFAKVEKDNFDKSHKGQFESRQDYDSDTTIHEKGKSARSCLQWEKKTSVLPKHFVRDTKPGQGYPKGTCDKCDGCHLTDDCPIYKKKRDDHPDAWRNFGRKSPLEMGKGGCVYLPI